MLIIHQIIIIITLIPRYYLTNMDISADSSVCSDVNSSDEKENNDQGSQDDSKNYEIGENDGILDSIIMIILNDIILLSG